ncbi:MAG: ornithine carbamoyltransferase [Planctomycetota bacterium]|mgnify:FL=1|nr:ornithine carbamoyltransferase [Planctomycetota bacterium]MDA1248424.1 ornithine carbamoyltransferase [Planctomycetota bacterium]
MRHLTTLFDLTADDVRAILARATELKALAAKGDRPAVLKNRVLTQIYDKPSLRTRLSFDAAMVHLGGESVFFTAQDAGLYGRESLADVARVVGGISDAIVLRTFSHTTIEEFCEWAPCPVINGLSDDYHPCQALTDYFTVQEVFGELSGQKIVFVGDGNNVAASLAILSSMLGLPMTLACPVGYELNETIFAEIRKCYPDSQFMYSHDPMEAVKDADVIYTDVWASMGQEAEAQKRNAAFAGFQVNAKLLAAAPSTCRFMHDLPARRGLEVTDEVMDGEQSIVFLQSENRMHLAKGVLAWLLEA